MLDLLFVFTAGLLGSAHCVGMCGGFVLAVSQAQGDGHGMRHQAAYFLGKALTYAALGAVAGGAGMALGGLAREVQNGLSLGAGLAMVAIGLGLVGVLGRVEGAAWLARWPPFGRAMGYFLKRRSLRGSFGLGLLNGALPCGLVYAMLAYAAATGSAGRGALAMFVFGAATVPALFALGLAGQLMRPVWRARLNRVAGVVVIVLGALTMLRGTPVLDGLMPHPPGHEMHDAHDVHHPAVHQR